MSHRTQIRDAIIQEFNNLRLARSGRVPEFEISTSWLTETETKRVTTYCVIITDESRGELSLAEDAFEMTGAVVLYAMDSADPRGKLDLMIEDAIEVLRRAMSASRSYLQNAKLDSITTSESSTVEGFWTQAVIRWMATHRRAVML